MRVRLDLGLRARTLDGAPGSGSGAGICDVIGRQRLRHGLQRGSHRGRHGDGGVAAIAGRRTNCRCCYCCQLDVRQFDPSRALIPPHGQKLFRPSCCTHKHTIVIHTKQLLTLEARPNWNAEIDFNRTPGSYRPPPSSTPTLLGSLHFFAHFLLPAHTHVCADHFSHVVVVGWRWCWSCSTTTTTIGCSTCRRCIFGFPQTLHCTAGRCSGGLLRRSFVVWSAVRGRSDWVF